MCVSGAFARTFLEPGTGFPMFDRFPRPSLASSLSFFPRSLLLKCVAAVPAAAGLSSWTSNILSTSLSVWVCVYVCKCMCVCGKSVEKNNNSPEGFSCSCSVCIYEIPPRGLSTALGHTVERKEGEKGLLTKLEKVDAVSREFKVTLYPKSSYYQSLLFPPPLLKLLWAKQGLIK